MATPAVSIQQLDGGLGVLPASSVGTLAVIGTSTAGAVDTPSSFGRVKALTDAFGSGPGVEAAALHIQQTGKPVVFVRATSNVDGAAGSIDDTYWATGTSVVTVDEASTQAVDDYEVVFSVVLGGVVETGPITIKYSLDGGRNFSPKVSLGTANTYTIPGTGIVLDFAAGTFVTGEYLTFRTTAPQWDATSLGTALDALINAGTSWGLVHVVGPLSTSNFDALETKFSGWAGQSKFRGYVAHVAVPTLAQTEATYLSSLTSTWSAKASTYGALCAGGCEVTSAVSGRAYLRPVSFIAASREAASSEEINTADVNLGSLPVSIRDENGNPKHHDEYQSPGLDDQRFYVLRSFPNLSGVYVNQPRLFSAEGSDFQYVPHRRVYNLAATTLDAYFTKRLNKPIQVDATTGFILEEEALEIEEGALRSLEAVLLVKPKASGVTVSLSRTDNLLSTKTLTVDARIVPLAYATTINVSLGFVNPALQIVKA